MSEFTEVKGKKAAKNVSSWVNNDESSEEENEEEVVQEEEDSSSEVLKMHCVL